MPEVQSMLPCMLSGLCVQHILGLGRTFDLCSFTSLTSLELRAGPTWFVPMPLYAPQLQQLTLLRILSVDCCDAMPVDFVLPCLQTLHLRGWRDPICNLSSATQLTGLSISAAHGSHTTPQKADAAFWTRCQTVQAGSASVFVAEDSCARCNPEF